MVAVNALVKRTTLQGQSQAKLGERTNRYGHRIPLVYLKDVEGMLEIPGVGLVYTTRLRAG